LILLTQGRLLPVLPSFVNVTIWNTFLKTPETRKKTPTGPISEERGEADADRGGKSPALLTNVYRFIE